MLLVPRLLCVAENLDERRRICEALRQEFPASQIESVGAAEQCLHLLEQSAFDVVITDVTVDGLDGFNLLRRAQECAPTCAVILCTTRGNEALAVRAMRSGFADYIGNSPHRYEELTATIRSLLNGSQAPSSEREESAVHRNLWEEELRRERQLFIGGPVVVFKCKAEEGWPVEYVSPNIVQFGYPPETFSSGTFSYRGLIHPEDEERVREKVRVASELGKETLEQEYRIRRADGKYRWIYDFTRIVRSPEGAVTHYDGYIFDITERRLAAQKLQTSEVRYRALVEGSIQGICVIDDDNSVLFANSALAAIFGASHPNELVGTNALRFLAPHERERITRYVAARRRGEPAPVRYEFQGQKRDGTPLWLEVLASVVSWKDRPAILGTYIDISSRKQAELALQQSEQQYRTLVEHLRDGVFIIQDGLMRFVNENFARMFGYRVEEMTNREFLAFVAPEDAALVRDRYRRRQAGEEVPFRYEFRLLHKDGETRVLVEMTAALIEYQGCVATMGTLRDVTEQRQAADLLHEEADINAALARVAREMIASLEASPLIERLCRVTAEVLGCDCSHTNLWMPEEEAYRTVAGYGDTPEQWETVQSLKIPRDAARDLAVRFLNGDDVILLEPSASSPTLLDRFLYKVGITASLTVGLRRGTVFIGALSASYRGRREFSARQRRLLSGIAQIASLALANARLLEEVERSNRVKEDFVGTMSHELRTPLNIILGYNGLVQEGTFGPVTEEQQAVLGRVDKSGRELLDLINATLDLSRLQSQRIPLDVREIRVPELLDELQVETQQLNNNPHLQVQWHLAPDLPDLRTDAVKLKMVLKNLVTNALKFTESGQVSVSAVPQDQGITFCVTDTGQGIAPEDLAIIFEPFRQGGAFATRHRGGVGLGLYIVRQLTNLLGGRVFVDSQLGTGSSFHVWFPQEKAKR
ncbi:MAG: PAS domain S-box protein [Deltaproteobacteria bacterium]|nr:PAS domain S-box protein [Deltaproteobacteria bacterium]